MGPSSGRRKVAAGCAAVTSVQQMPLPFTPQCCPRPGCATACHPPNRFQNWTESSPVPRRLQQEPFPSPAASESVSLPFATLKPGADLSPPAMQVIGGIFFQWKAVWSPVEIRAAALGAPMWWGRLLSLAREATSAGFPRPFCGFLPVFQLVCPSVQRTTTVSYRLCVHWTNTFHFL